ncbi:Mu transposase C-terminal domain-containing protein [Streptosporangium sp. NPDC020072]|uniref:Mu transposase C-terminal domain-containing protein n=1 Tax=Streptosporangium sp. NPDC020072 TaxID=3154788 RepID=UPI0034313D86
MSGPEAGPPPLARLSSAARQEAVRRFQVLQPHLEDGISLTEAARMGKITARTARRWAARYRNGGLAALAPRTRSDAGTRRMPEQLRMLIEALALRSPQPSAATVYRQTQELAREHGWPPPGRRTVANVIADLDPALKCLAHEGRKRYTEVFELIARQEVQAPNARWQADHTQLDFYVLAEDGSAARPWLTLITDEYSRAIAAYRLSLEAPSAAGTALTLRRAIWRKGDPHWQVCGIPAVFYTDHGSDFTSAHLEQVAADLKMRLVFSLPGQPRGRGKIERLFSTVHQMCLSALPGYAPAGLPERARQARLSMAQLEEALHAWIVGDYHLRAHSETRQPPATRWVAGGFLPQMPESLEQLDLLLLTVAKPRKVHPDGIHAFGLRYLDPTLAAFVGESVIIRYDPCDLAELRIFHRGDFICRAICAELAGTTTSMREITAARRARRRQLTRDLAERTSLVDQLLSHRTGLPAPSAEPIAAPPVQRRLKIYTEEWRSTGRP